jgi:hypothetical protein
MQREAVVPTERRITHDWSAARPRTRGWLRVSRWKAWLRQRSGIISLGLALLPLAAGLAWAMHATADARRNVVYWDELDTALALVLRLEAGPTAMETAREILRINNEHRMVTSRLLFIVQYHLTGTLNFDGLNWLGNLSILTACVILVLHAGTPLRRLLLGLALGLMIFQLGNYENLLWSGASIDHFTVLLLATVAALALANPTTTRTVVAALAGIAASFTLAHGLAIWPAGILALRARRRALLAWLVTGTAAATAFLSGFRVNEAQSFPEASIEAALRVMKYWLALLGATPSVGHTELAPWAGAALLGGIGWMVGRRRFRRDPAVAALLAFLLIGAALIAAGRAEHSQGVVFSRYHVISALAWAVTFTLVLEHIGAGRHPRLTLAAGALVLTAFFFASNRSHADETDSWITCRDLAVNHYIRHRADGRGAFALHPQPAHSTRLLREAEGKGVYVLPPACLPATPEPAARESARIAYYVEEAAANDTCLAVTGWAGIPGLSLRRGDIRLILRHASGPRVFSTVTVPREDVPRLMKQPTWTNSGFSFVVPAGTLPPGEHRIGLLLGRGRNAEYVMTATSLHVPPPRAETAAR